MKKFILFNFLISLLFSVDACCMRRSGLFPKFFSVGLSRFISTTQVRFSEKNPYEILNVSKDEAIDKLFKDKFNVLYSDKLVLDNDLQEFKELVSDKGFKIDVLPKNQIKFIGKIPKNYIAPKMEIKKIDDVIGYGVFAKEKISAGSFIKQYTGKVMVIDHTQCWKKKYLFSVCGDLKKLALDAEFIGNETRFFNHSYVPNSCIFPVYSSESPEFVQYWIVALKDILPEQEIVWNYTSGYWKTHGMVPFEKHVRHIYQDRLFSIYAYPKKGLSSIFIDEDPILDQNGKTFVVEILASTVMNNKDNIFIVIMTKQNEKIVPMIFIESGTNLGLISDISACPKALLEAINKWFSNIGKK